MGQQKKRPLSGNKALIGYPEEPDDKSVGTSFTATGSARPRTLTLDVYVGPRGSLPGDPSASKVGANVSVDAGTGNWSTDVMGLTAGKSYTIQVTVAGDTTPLDSVDFTTAARVTRSTGKAGTDGASQGRKLAGKGAKK
jgi:hypothetical protein